MSGDGNNGTDTAITYVNGKFGQAASFNGSSSTIAMNSRTPSFPAGTSARTLAIWANFSGTPSSGINYTLLAYGSQSNNQLYLCAYSNSSDTYQLKVFAFNNDVGINLLGGAISTGVWHRIVFTFSGTTLTTYLDGNLQGTATHNSVNTVNNNNSNYIGSYIGTVSFMNGLLDEPLIENRVWSASEVRKDFTMGKGRFGL